MVVTSVKRPRLRSDELRKGSPYLQAVMRENTGLHPEAIPGRVVTPVIPDTYKMTRSLYHALEGGKCYTLAPSFQMLSWSKNFKPKLPEKD